MWLVYSRTHLATSLGVLIPSSAATAPARRVGPCMHDASSWTTPSSLGRPPYPTDVSSGSNSWIFTPSIPASRVSTPRVGGGPAFSTPPLHDVKALQPFAPAGRTPTA